MEYKQTLNMNKSGFPMRGGLPMREPDMLKNWQELDLYNELLKKMRGSLSLPCTTALRSPTARCTWATHSTSASRTS